MREFGWPPPERIAVKLKGDGEWAVADVQTLDEEELQRADAIYHIDKDRTSTLPDDHPDFIVRGATYTLDKKED